MYTEQDLIHTKRTLLMGTGTQPRPGWIMHILVLGLDAFACTGARIGAFFPDDSDKNWRSKGLRYKVSVQIETSASATNTRRRIWN
jgi:hypothetical protein